MYCYVDISFGNFTKFTATPDRQDDDIKRKTLKPHEGTRGNKARNNENKPTKYKRNNHARENYIPSN